MPRVKLFRWKPHAWGYAGIPSVISSLKISINNKAMRNVKATAYLVLKGVAMGSADIIPGVSGGTIAFITGIYEKLIRSIKSVDQRAFRLLLSKDFKGVWKHINGNFLLPVFLGIIVSILSFARILSWLLDTYPIQLWSFFFGLVLIAAVSVFRTIKRRTGGVFPGRYTGYCHCFYHYSILTC